MRLFLLFLVLPIVEIYLLIQVGSVIGVFPTLALIVLTAAVGSGLARREGLAVWQKLMAQTATGQMPTNALVDGGIILSSGLLLLTPGILTDIIGFAGLIPLTRNRLRPFVISWLKGRVRISQMPARQTQPEQSNVQEWQGTPSQRPGYRAAT